MISTAGLIFISAALDNYFDKAENSLKVSFTDPDKFISSFLFQNQD